MVCNHLDLFPFFAVVVFPCLEDEEEEEEGRENRRGEEERWVRKKKEKEKENWREKESASPRLNMQSYLRSTATIFYHYASSPPTEAGDQKRSQLRLSLRCPDDIHPSVYPSFPPSLSLGRITQVARSSSPSWPSLLPLLPQLLPLSFSPPRSLSFSSSQALTCWPWCSSPPGATACRGCASRTASGGSGRRTR